MFSARDDCVKSSFYLWECPGRLQPWQCHSLSVAQGSGTRSSAEGMQPMILYILQPSENAILKTAV